MIRWVDSSGGTTLVFSYPRAAKLAVIAAKTGGGWMGIEPTQDASHRPANGFEDRALTFADVRGHPLQIESRPPESVAVRPRPAVIRKVGCRLDRRHCAMTLEIGVVVPSAGPDVRSQEGEDTLIPSSRAAPPRR
jgi:hypothetical protein